MATRTARTDVDTCGHYSSLHSPNIWHYLIHLLERNADETSGHLITACVCMCVCSQYLHAPTEIPTINGNLSSKQALLFAYRTNQLGPIGKLAC